MKYIYILITFSLSTFSWAQQSNNKADFADIQAINFRDIGGYVTEQGNVVKHNKLFRSGELSRLSNENLIHFKKLNIKTIIDFRSNDEVEKAPDNLSQDIIYQQLSAGSEDLGNWQNILTKTKNGDSLMLSFYSKTDYLGDKYRPFFHSLLEAPKETSIVFHCTAGKDRTGIAAALLLYILGVSQEDIINDYLASNNYRKEENQKLIHQMKLIGIDEQVATDIVIVKPEYLTATYNAIIDKYGSIEDFVEQKLNLKADDIKLLRQKYTEKL